MRGIYNGEIKDRPHIFDILGFIFLLGIISFFWFGSAFNAWKKADLTRGIILPIGGIISLWYFLIAIGREFVFLRINKEKIIVKRPLLRLSPFKKDKALVVLLVKEVAEINIGVPPGKRGTPTWKFISHDKKEQLRFRFDPEFLFHTIEPIRVTWKHSRNLPLVIGNAVIGNQSHKKSLRYKLPALPVLLLVFLILQPESLFPADELRVRLLHFLARRITALPQKRQAENSRKKQCVSHACKTLFAEDYWVRITNVANSYEIAPRYDAPIRNYSRVFVIRTPRVWIQRAASIF